MSKLASTENDFLGSTRLIVAVIVCLAAVSPSPRLVITVTTASEPSSAWKYYYSPVLGQFFLGIPYLQGDHMVVSRRHKETAHKEDFRNRTCVTLKWRYFWKPPHMLINRTNEIASFAQPMKLDQSNCLFWSDYECFDWHKLAYYTSGINCIWFGTRFRWLLFARSACLHICYAIPAHAELVRHGTNKIKVNET